MKKIFTLLSLFLTLQAYCQSGSNNSEYSKFYLSLNAGWDFTLGKSNTVLSEDFTLPLTKNGFTPGLDAAWFFSKNYGVGVKYRYYAASRKDISWEYTEETFEYPVYEWINMSQKEKVHAFGPAFFARWSFGSPKWVFSANAGLMYLHDKLSKIEKAVHYHIDIPSDVLYDLNKYPQNSYIGYVDHFGNTIGFAFSAGIRYQIIPLIGVGINANGLFGSLSEMKYENRITGKQETANLSRKMNRIGIFAAIDFSF